MKRFSTRVLVGAGAVGLLLLFYARANRIVSSEHERFDQSLRKFKQLDVKLNEDVLKSRFRLLEDYDTFLKQVNELNKTAEDLKMVPTFVPGSARTAILGKIQELAGLLSEKGDLLEDFKSQNAVLNNSLRYFPQAGTDLMRRLPTDGSGRALELDFNELMRKVLMYSLNPTEELSPAILESLKRLDAWRAEHQEVETTTFTSLTAHVYSILRRKPRVETLTRELIAVPLGDRADELLHLYEDEFARALGAAELYRLGLILLCIGLFICVGYMIYALRTANSRLEQRVAERTKELSDRNDQLQAEISERQRTETKLEEAHKQLVTASRQAGMAEVATGVLHNVGNVLNSVNVSATLVSDGLKKSKVASFAKATELLREHAADLGAYLTADPKGKQLPGFFCQLAERLSAEQGKMVTEMEQLRKNIEHIKDIVSMQQTYARIAGVTETIKATELVEDAIRLNASSLLRHDVQVVREYEAQPTLTVDKHKALQILVNLIRNAKQACDEAGHAEKRLTLKVTNGEGRIKISVIDNGVGIPPENMTRIFNHGFTTRKDGHGFGLHSGALAAKEMGAALTVCSEGKGRGTTFTLDLPTEPTKKERLVHN